MPKIIWTDEDRQLVESLVNRFDPAKVLTKSASISEEDWNFYLEGHRVELRRYLEAAMLAKGLHEAGYLKSLTTPDVGEVLQFLDFDFTSSDEARRTAIMDRLDDGLTAKEADQRTEPLGKTIDEAIDRAIGGAVAASA